MEKEELRFAKTSSSMRIVNSLVPTHPNPYHILACVFYKLRPPPPGKTNMTGGENPPWMKMHFLLKMGFHLVMLVFVGM